MSPNVTKLLPIFTTIRNFDDTLFTYLMINDIEIMSGQTENGN